MFFGQKKTKMIYSCQHQSIIEGNRMNRKSDRILSLQIAGLQGFYWMIFCPISAYASVYLLSKAFSNQSIGWIIAISSILAIIFQPALGVFHDRFTKINIKTTLWILSVFCLAMLAGMIFFDPKMLMLAILYVGIMALLVTMQPLVNALTFQYINAGRDINFGVTRSAGSLCFAALSIFLGIWVDRYSTDILPIVSFILFAAYALLLFTFPKVDQPGKLEKSPVIPENSLSSAPEKGFLTRYYRFIPFLLGVALIFLFHNVINTYLAQIIRSLQGKDTDLGIALTIAAVLELPAFLGFSWLVARINSGKLLKFSGVFYVIRSIVFLMAASVWMVNLGQALQALSFAIFIPASVYFINEMMKEEDRVKGQTFITGSITLGGFFGSVIGGRLLDQSGIFALLLFGGIAALLGALLLFYSIPAQKKHPTDHPIP